MTNRCPAAGAIRLVVNDTVSTAALGGIVLNAAYPQAVSSTAVTAPACRKPCCWVNRSS